MATAVNLTMPIISPLTYRLFICVSLSVLQEYNMYDNDISKYMGFVTQCNCPINADYTAK